MPIFIFHGRDNTGVLKTGKRTAYSADTLCDQLIAEGVIPVHIYSASEAKSLWLKFKDKLTEKPITSDELSLFARQMYTLCKTAVPIASALRQLAENIPNPSLANAILGVVENLEMGMDLASSMQIYSHIFTPIVISMIKVGQSSGQLAQAFLRINQYLELEAAATKDVKTALRYPIFVLLSLLAAIVLINVFVIPAFSKVFISAKLDLPLATRVLMVSSHFFMRYWVGILLLILIFMAVIYVYTNSQQGKIARDHFLLNIPYVGRILKRIVLLRFAQSFSIIIDSGVPLLAGIELVASAVNNEYAKMKISAMRDSIEHGYTLTQAAAASKLFTPLELQMLSVSEETGELGNMLIQIAAFYKREVEYDLKQLSDVIEPILIMILSGVILVLALAVYLPIWNMVKLSKVG
jgi:MSHA biogenesis protein MshG